MVKATHPTAKKIAVVFDFDDTLVPDSFDGLLEYVGIDPAEFRKNRYERRKAEGWDAIPARFYSLIEYSRSQSEPSQKITKETLTDFGRQHLPFDGVPEMFDALRAAATNIAPDVTVEYYLITSGFAEVARNSKIAECFTAMWGCEFHYSETGEIEFLKRSLTHPEKPRYLYYLSKGIDSHNSDNLLFVYEDVAPENRAIPLTQVIYVGDGTSDIPCFSMLNQEGGIAIGVNKHRTPEEWAQEYQPTRGQRVINLAPADYTAESELMQSLQYAVEGICKKIQLQQLSEKG